MASEDEIKAAALAIMQAADRQVLVPYRRRRRGEVIKTGACFYEQARDALEAAERVRREWCDKHKEKEDVVQS